MATVRATGPHVGSAQAGGLSPVGLDGLETMKGPPVKVRAPLDGESVPLGGAVAASAVTGNNVATRQAAANARTLRPRLRANVRLPPRIPGVGRLRPAEAFVRSL